MKLQRAFGVAMAAVVGAASLIGIQATGASAASIVNWTPVGTSQTTYSIAIDSSGNLYTANYSAAPNQPGSVTKITPGGVTSTLATTGINPTGIAVDSLGNVYTANLGSDTVSKILPDGTVSTLGPTGSQPFGIAIDLSTDTVYTSNSNGGSVTKITSGGVVSTLGTTGMFPRSIALDSSGNVYTANLAANNVSKILPDGTSSTLGTTGAFPYAIAVDAAGNVYTANYSSNNVSKILPDGTSSILGTTGAGPRGIVLDGAGNVYTANSDNASVTKIAPDGTSTTFGTTGSTPRAITTDLAGYFYTANSGSSNVSKLWQSAPTITSVAPSTGSTSGGTSITITGTDFVEGALVTVGGSACTSVVVVSSTSITCTTPAGTAGAVDVVVTNTDAGTDTEVGGFTYAISSPSITDVAPGSGATYGGTAITITGTDFYPNASVTVGGAACTSIVVVSPTSITCTTPAGSVGAVNVVVTNTDTGTATDAGGFTYTVSNPTITDVAPDSGSTYGGTAITITGTDFYAGATVTVGGAACTSVVVVSATSITCTTPAGAAGAANVVVTNTDSQAVTATGGFTYVTSAPSITTVSPASGPRAGGTTITITGTDFYPGATVSVGGAACTDVTVVSATEITCKTPAGVAGAVSVVVTNTDSGTASKASVFTYQNNATKPAPPRALKMVGGPTAKKFVFKWKAPKTGPKTGYLVTIHQRGKPRALLSKKQNTNVLTFTITRKSLLKLATMQSRGDMGNINFIFRVRTLNDQAVSTADVKRFLVRI